MPSEEEQLAWALEQSLLPPPLPCPPSFAPIGAPASAAASQQPASFAPGYPPPASAAASQQPPSFKGRSAPSGSTGLQPGTSEEYTVPQFTFEELECCEQLGGDKAFRLIVDLQRCLTTKGTGIKVAPDMLTFRAKEVGYEIMYKWPQRIDETRAITKFSKKDRKLTVVAPLLQQ